MHPTVRITCSVLLYLTAMLTGPNALAAQDTAGQRLTVDSAVGELIDNPASLKVLQKIIPSIANSPQINDARDLPLREIARYVPTVLTDKAMKSIDAELARTPGAVASGKIRLRTGSIDPRIPLTLKTVPLWSGDAPGARGHRPEDMPTLTIVAPDGAPSFGTAVLVAPGGAYQGLATGQEGRQVADWFAAHGVTAFVLSYRLTPFGYAHPTQLLDAKRAIRWIRNHASEYGINPSRVGMIGFSAGGHLTAMAATLFDEGEPKAVDPIDRLSSRPDFAVLAYAAIELSEARLREIGLITPDSSPAALNEVFPARHIKPDTPPTFIYHTTTDELVKPRNATLIYDALVAANVPVEMHIFAEGRHGIGLAMTDSALSVWPALMQSWLEKIGMIGPKALAGP